MRDDEAFTRYFLIGTVNPVRVKYDANGSAFYAENPEPTRERQAKERRHAHQRHLERRGRGRYHRAAVPRAVQARVEGGAVEAARRREYAALITGPVDPQTAAQTAKTDTRRKTKTN